MRRHVSLVLALAASLTLPLQAQVPPAPPAAPPAVPTAPPPPEPPPGPVVPPAPPAPPAVPSMPAPPAPPAPPLPPANALEQLAAAIPGVVVRYDRLTQTNDSLVAEGVTFVRGLPGGGTDESAKLYVKRIEVTGLDEAAFKTVFDPNSYAGATDETFRTLFSSLILTEASFLVDDKAVFTVASWAFTGLEMKQFPFIPGGPEFMQQFTSRDAMAIQMMGGFIDSLKVASIQMNGIHVEFDPTAMAAMVPGAIPAARAGAGLTVYDYQELRQEAIDRGRYGRVTFRGLTSSAPFPDGGVMKLSLAEGYWDGIDISRVLPFMIKAEWPPVTREGLISYGTACATNYDLSLTGIGTLNVPQFCMQAIPFVWLIPQNFDVAFEGTFTPAPAGEFLAPPYIAKHFTGPMPVAIQISGNYDPDLGTASLTHYRLRLGGFGELDWMGTAGGLRLDELMTLPETYATKLSFVGAGFKIVDEGGMQKILEMASEASNPPGQTQVTPDALKLQAKAGLDMAVGMLGASPEARALVDAIKAFIDEGGTLEIVSKPSVPLTMPDFLELSAKPPAEILAALGVSATHSAP
jgi:hypothetical protein